MRLAVVTTGPRRCGCVVPCARPAARVPPARVLPVHRVALDDDRDTPDDPVPPPAGAASGQEPGRDTPDAALRRLVRDWLAGSRDALTEKAIERALREGKAALLANDPVWADRWDDLDDDWQDSLRRLMRRAGAAELRRLDLPLGFALDNPYAVRFALTQTAEMVKAVTAETKKAIRAVVGAGFVEHYPPRDMAKLVKPMIGLTAPDARAVRNRAAKLAKDDLSPERVQELTDRYAEKLLKRRAENIARTETINSLSAGNNAAWRSADEAGLLPKGTEREWMATPTSGRTCTICARLHGKRIPLDGTYTHPVTGAPINHPGGEAHPSCRCAERLVFSDSAPARPAAPKTPKSAGPFAPE